MPLCPYKSPRCTYSHFMSSLYLLTHSARCTDAGAPLGPTNTRHNALGHTNARQHKHTVLSVFQSDLHPKQRRLVHWIRFWDLSPRLPLLIVSRLGNFQRVFKIRIPASVCICKDLVSDSLFVISSALNYCPDIVQCDLWKQLSKLLRNRQTTDIFYDKQLFDKQQI